MAKNNTQKPSEEFWNQVDKDGISNYERFIEPLLANVDTLDGVDLEVDVIEPMKAFVAQAIQATREETIDTSKITRMEVIDDKDGRAYVNWEEGNNVKLSFQDENRTLKVFITNSKHKRKE